MTITIDLPPELEAHFVADAKVRGVAIDVVVRDYLMQRAPHAATPTSNNQDWEREFRAWVESHDPAVPPLSDEAVSRESIYGE